MSDERARKVKIFEALSYDNLYGFRLKVWTPQKYELTLHCLIAGKHGCIVAIHTNFIMQDICLKRGITIV